MVIVSVLTREVVYVKKLMIYKGIVGTVEEKQSYDYISEVITNYKKEAQGLPGSPKFDIWLQQGTSSHRFDIMDKSE